LKSIKKHIFPKPFEHDHPPVQNVNELLEKKKTFGQKAADRIAVYMGSWKFIIFQSLILTIWVLINITAYVKHWDPYPFILMNLVLSLQAAYAAPIIMMSQNRAAERDRVEARNDYMINQKAEEEIRIIMDLLNVQNEVLANIIASIEKIDINENHNRKVLRS
jgi:uncharacterized membrane protein